MRESTLELRLVREVERVGGFAVKWVSPGHRGVPDRIVILPEGRTVYVEMKAPGKPLSPLQNWWAERLRKKGHAVYAIDSIADIQKFIQEVTSDGV